MASKYLDSSLDLSLNQLIYEFLKHYQIEFMISLFLIICYHPLKNLFFLQNCNSLILFIFDFYPLNFYQLQLEFYIVQINMLSLNRHLNSFQNHQI